MGCLYGFLKKILKLIIYSALVSTLIIFIPNLPPYTKFSHIQLTPTQENIGALAPNAALNGIQKLYEGKILGPEAFQIWKNELYTSIATGEIVKLSSGGHVTFVTKIGQPCTGLTQEHICGRPLGFEIDENKGLLYVADAYHGIWKVDLKTDKKQQLVSPDVPIDGRKPRLFNSVALGKNGGVYWTDSCSDFSLMDGVFIGLSDPSGRLFYHNPTKNENTVLLDDIWFANGIVISPDESFVVVVETLKQRLLKYYISGPKKGKSDVFVDGLPGAPDNIRALPDGSGVQIALYSASDENNPILTRNLASLPMLRKLLARVMRLVEIPFEYLNSQFPNQIFEEIVYRIGHIAGASALAPDMSGLLIVDWNGNIVASFYNTDGGVSHISDAIVFNDKLVLGCPHKQDFVAAVPIPPLMKQAYLAKGVKENVPTPIKREQQNEIPKQKPVEIPTTTTEKPTTTTPKPTTTTPKPTTTTTKPTTTTPKPTTTTQKPTTTTPIPTTTTQKPTTTTQKPTTTTQKPVTTTEKPTTITQKPSTEKASPPHKEPEGKPKTKQPGVNSNIKSQDNLREPQPKINNNAGPKPSMEKEKPKTASENKATPNQSDSKPTKSDSGKVEKKIENPSEKPVKKQQDAKPKKVDTNIPNDKPNTIPIVEDIVSDTAKPSKDKLKVIKKSGPEEIPHPNI